MLNETSSERRARRHVERSKRALKRYMIAQTVIIGFALMGVFGFAWGVMHDSEGVGVGEALAVTFGALMAIMGATVSVLYMLEDGEELHNTLANAKEEQEELLAARLKREGFM